MAMYSRDDIPTDHSWTRGLSAKEAELQCIEWGIPPNDTLEANRVILRSFVLANNKSKTPKSDPTDKSSGSSLTLSNPDDEVPKEEKTPIAKTPITTTPPEVTNTQDVFQLIQNMHSESMRMTMEAVQQVVGAIATQQTTTSGSDKAIISELLREVRPNSGTDPIRNVHFLQKIDSILEAVPGHDRDIIQQILPFTRDKVREFWKKISGDATWEQVVSDFLFRFFTQDSLRQVKEHFLFRPQREGEELEEYISSVRRSFKILQPNSQDAEIFETIFLKISRETRTSLNSVGVMRSLQDIIGAASRADALTKAAKNMELDRHRQGHNTTSNFAPTNNHYRPTERQHTDRNNTLTHHRYRRDFTRQFRPSYNHRPSNPGQYSGQFVNQYASQPAYQQARPPNMQPPAGFTPGYTNNAEQVQNRRQQNKEALNFRGGR